MTDPAGLEITEVKPYGQEVPEVTGQRCKCCHDLQCVLPQKKLAPYSFTLMVNYTEGVPDMDFYGNALTVDTTRSDVQPDIALDSSGAPIVV
ncbi:hypothetical protein [Deinococcus roseus]|uniref:Uncharacterized protein n=1 Tax=Deinococcus roseus TaxID=392414 RepID=A0ABQ2DAV0_9DEIO|nr:hypothetical protein [Deinococcus roseus]GGJ51702.1 hypothetical protein GCM10008938_42160 [Deinococcus roseus]